MPLLSTLAAPPAIYASLALRAQVPTSGEVTIAPGLYRFVDLAAQLTQAGIPVRCDKAVASRLALLRLDARPWEALRPLLESALGVRFRLTEDGTVVMEEDPEQARREKRQMAQLDRMYSVPFQDAARRGIALAARLESLEGPELTKAANAVRAGTAQDKASFVAYTLVNKSNYIGGGAVIPRLANGFLLARLLDSRLDVTAPLSATIQKAEAGQIPFTYFWAQQTEALNRASRLVPNPDDLEPFKEALAHATVRERVSIDPFTLSLTGAFNFIIPPNTSPIRWGSESSIILTSESLPPPFGLSDVQPDAEEKTRYARRQKDTAAFLERAEPEKDASPSPVPDHAIRLAPAERTFSAALWQWSNTRKRQLIMEVSPVRDVLPPKFAVVKQVSLRDAFMPLSKAERNGAYLQTLPYTEANPDLRLQNNLEQTRGLRWIAMLPCLKRDSWWTAHEQGDVVVVRNEWQFLDHRKTPDTKAAVRLWKIRQQHPQQALSLEEVVAATGDTTPEQNALALPSTIYEDTPSFAQAYPYLDLLRQHPDFRNLLLRLRSDLFIELPSGGLSADTKRRFIESLKQMAQAKQGTSVLPTLSESAVSDAKWPVFQEQSALRLELKAYPGKGDLYWLCCAIVTPTPSQEQGTVKIRTLEAYIGPLTR